MTTDDVRHEAEIDGVTRHPRAPADGSSDRPDVQHKRALANGFGNAMGRATEIALLPAIFGGLGWLVDRWLGTEPGFFIGFLVFAFAGMLVRMWLGYDAEMRRHEVELTDRLADARRTRKTQRRQQRTA